MNAFPGAEVVEAAVGVVIVDMGVEADSPGKPFESHCGGVALTGVGAMGDSLNDSTSDRSAKEFALLSPS